ncbi:DUF2306 domain-containing protein [Acidicapsa dinghuensis]|uniref:DUF2306 domain-containing protein n=1 Tax=Acidicapsa dinghuensis TaxID=2218256 RepID=A0ABW1EKN7_9BACT|nr:DUF2306 domain-containing protein [Acidicapsa dinghuensis]
MATSGQSWQESIRWGGFPLWMKVGFWGCMLIAVAVVLRRAVSLLSGPGAGAPPQLQALDNYFASQALLTWTHILCALVFVLLFPLIFWRRTANSGLLARIFFALGLVVGLTAYAMSAHAVGGWLERSAVLFFNSLFLVCLIIAFRKRFGDEPERAKPWILRSVAIVLGIATTRPVMGVFFATSRVTHLTPQQFFGIAFWIGFSINTIGMELWLRLRQPFLKGNE